MTTRSSSLFSAFAFAAVATAVGCSSSPDASDQETGTVEQHDDRTCACFTNVYTGDIGVTDNQQCEAFGHWGIPARWSAFQCQPVCLSWAAPGVCNPNGWGQKLLVCQPRNGTQCITGR